MLDIFNRSSRSASEGSILTQTTATPCDGSRRGKALASHHGLTTAEPMAAEPYFEGMETRLLLAVDAADFARLQSQYPDLGLSAYSNYKIYEVTELNQANLQSAINSAGTNTNPQNSLIVVRTSATQNTIYLSSQLTINFSTAYGTVTIVSLSLTDSEPIPLTLDAQKNSRVLNISNSSANVSLAGLAITNGLVAGDGGGISNVGTLTVAYSTIKGNTASSSSFAFGGGISSSGTLRMTSSIITGNTASGSSFALGGGIFGDGRLTVTNSVIAGNVASGVLASQGGGICHWGASDSTLTVTNSTIVMNTVSASGPGGSFAGGGIFSSGTATLTNTIVVENGLENISGSSVTGHNNLTTFTGWNSGSSGNLPHYTALPLFANAAAGDYRLVLDSQAIDKGNNQRASTAGLTTGSRDLAGNPRIFDGTIDIGAYEYQGPVVHRPAPRPLANFTSPSQTWNSITLSWTGQDNVVSYTLQYKQSTESTWTTWTPAPGTGATSATITGLAANTAYDFQLTATNENGSATSSTNATTNVALPTAPENFTSPSKTPNSVTLSWTAQGNLVGYTLQYRVSGETTWQTYTPAPGTSATSATVPGLAANTTYDFQLTATGAGGSASSTVSVTTPVVAPMTPVAPENFGSTAQTLNSVTLEWKSQSSLTSYTLQYRVSGVATWQTWTPAPGTNATTATITGLSPSTTYNFQLTATNTNGSATSSVDAMTVSEVGEGPRTPDKTVMVATKPGAPKAGIGAQSITLTWAAPKPAKMGTSAANTEVDGFWIEWFGKDKKTPINTLWVSVTDANVWGNRFETVIPSLQPGVSYSFRIYTTTAAGTISTKFATVSAKTKAIPAPTSVKVKADGIGAVLITWKAPKATTMPTADMNITGYKIYDLNNNPIGSIGVGGTSFRVDQLAGGATLKPNAAYSFRIVAVFEPQTGGAPVESAKPVKVKGKTAKFVAPKLAPKSATLISDITTASITLRWQACPDADNFLVTCVQKAGAVVLNFDFGGNASFLTDGQDNIIGVTITGLQPGVKYDFAIQATNSTLNAASAVLKKSVMTLKHS